MAQETFWCKCLIGSPLGFEGGGGERGRREEGGGNWKKERNKKKLNEIEYVEKNIFSN